MLYNLFNADLQIPTFVEVPYKLFSNKCIIWGDQGLQLLEQCLGQCFPGGNACQRIRFVFAVYFGKPVIVEIIEFLLHIPKSICRALIVAKSFIGCHSGLGKVSTDNTGLTVQLATTKETDALFTHFQGGLLNLFLSNSTFQLIC